jgi:hypothetical protein
MYLMMEAVKNSYKFTNKMKKLVIVIVFINVLNISISQQAAETNLYQFRAICSY